MRVLPKFFLLGLVALATSCRTPNSVESPGCAILKVNRVLLDEKGYETDVVGNLKEEADYQFLLRHEPTKQQGVRFHIKWKAPRHARSLRLQVEIRGLNAQNQTTSDVESLSLEENEGWAGWSTLEVTEKKFKKLGQITAWKITLFSGGQAKAVLPSANWYEDILNTQPSS